MDRIIPEERIKTITICERIHEKLADEVDVIKISKKRMIEKIAYSIAERLIKFDKVRIEKRKLPGFREVLLTVSFDVIVPEGRQER